MKMLQLGVVTKLLFRLQISSMNNNFPISLVQSDPNIFIDLFTAAAEMIGAAEETLAKL